jgi:hypothetical protein
MSSGVGQAAAQPCDALNRFGQAARYMCSPVANTTLEGRGCVFFIQLMEAVNEWRRCLR